MVHILVCESLLVEFSLMFIDDVCRPKITYKDYYFESYTEDFGFYTKVLANR